MSDLAARKPQHTCSLIHFNAISHITLPCASRLQTTINLIGDIRIGPCRPLTACFSYDVGDTQLLDFAGASQNLREEPC